MKYKSIVFLVIFSLAVLSSSVLAEDIKTTVETGGPSAGEALIYQGPKARIAIASFECKAAECYDWYNSRIGDGLKDMLATILFKTGKFILLERGEGLDAIKEEIDLSQSEYVEKGKDIQKGLLEGADILVMGAVTEFEPEASGSKAGGVVVPWKVPFVGGVKVDKNNAYIAADIRLVDTRTGRVISVAKVEGEAKSWDVGVGAGFAVGSVALAGGMSKYKNTPMEKAVRAMLANAVNTISQGIPDTYYRYKGEGEYDTGGTAQTSAAITGSAPSSTEIVGGSGSGAAESFTSGTEVVFSEDFGNYSIGSAPTSLTNNTEVEVAKFNNKNWLRFLKAGDVKKSIDLGGRDFSLEFSVYFPPASEDEFQLSINLKGNINKLVWKKDGIYLNDRLIKTSPIERKNIHPIAFQHIGTTIKIFFDGIKIYEEETAAGGIVGGKESAVSDEITFSGVNVEGGSGKELLLTNIKIACY